MSYVLTQFDGVVLPVYKQRDMADIGYSGPALPAYQRTAGGRFVDTQGTGRSPKGISELNRACEIFGTDWADVRSQLDALEAKKGVRGRLTKEYRDGTLRWQWARLVQVEAPSSLRTWNSQTVFVSFQAEQPEWKGTDHGDTWTWGDYSWRFGDGTATFGTDTETALTATDDAGAAEPTQEFTLANNGTLDARDLTITITAGTNTITGVTWSNATSGYSWTWTGTVASTKALVIDMDAMTVTNDGNNAYSGFAPGNLAIWDKIVPGDNVVTVTILGNAAQDATISWTYWDIFA